MGLHNGKSGKASITGKNHVGALSTSLILPTLMSSTTANPEKLPSPERTPLVPSPTQVPSSSICSLTLMFSTTVNPEKHPSPERTTSVPSPTLVPSSSTSSEELD